MPFTRYAFLLFVFALMQVFPAQVAQARTEGDFTKLSNGRNLDAFDTFIRDLGLNNGINRVFRVHDDMIHVSGKQYSYFITKKEYENYHLKLEFKWGVKTHAPRKKQGAGQRNSLPRRRARQGLAEIRRIPDDRGADGRGHLRRKRLIVHRGWRNQDAYPGRREQPLRAPGPGPLEG